MIEPAFETLLVAAIRRATLTEARRPAARQAAIALSAVAVRAQEEHRAAFAGVTKPLPPNYFSMYRHASSQAALDNGNGFVARLEPARWLPDEGCHNGTPSLATAGFRSASRLRSHIT
jgi:hypothetical protein